MLLPHAEGVTDWLVGFDTEQSSAARRLHEAFDSYQAAFTSCEWRPSDNFTYIYQRSNADWWANVGFQLSRRTWICTRRSTRRGREWRILKTDVARSVGGFDWHTVFGHGFPPLGDGHDAVTGPLATASIFAATDEAGVPYEYPPIHFHHGHVRKEVDALSNALILQSHADTHCHTLEGGAKCFLEAFPPPFALRLPRTALRWDAQFNDVRPKGSPLLKSLFVFGVELLVAGEDGDDEGDGNGEGGSSSSSSSSSGGGSGGRAGLGGSDAFDWDDESDSGSSSHDLGASVFSAFGGQHTPSDGAATPSSDGSSSHVAAPSTALAAASTAAASTAAASTAAAPTTAVPPPRRTRRLPVALWTIGNVAGPQLELLDAGEDPSQGSVTAGLDLYGISTSEETLLYTSYRAPRTGRLAHAFLHTHAFLFDECFVFSAAPARLGLDLLGFEDRTIRGGPRLLIPSERRTNASAIKAQIGATWGHPHLRCHGQRTNRTLERVDDGWYDRHGVWPAPLDQLPPPRSPTPMDRDSPLARTPGRSLALCRFRCP